MVETVLFAEMMVGEEMTFSFAVRSAIAFEMSGVFLPAVRHCIMEEESYCGEYPAFPASEAITKPPTA